MTKGDLLAGLGSSPVLFEVNGFPVHLRPLTAADRLELVQWRQSTKDDPSGPLRLVAKLAALAVCDPAGKRLLSVDEALSIDAPKLDAIATRVAELNGLTEREPGKAPSPETPA